MQINGIAHIQITVSNFQKCLPFYKQLLEYFEMTPMFETDGFYYCVGGRTGIAISQATSEFKNEVFEQTRIGLHHFCIRLRQRDDIDKLAEFVTKIGAKIVRPPAQQDHWAPGMYSVLFEDPDGIRIEANFVPGKGNLNPNVGLPKDS